MMVNTSAYIKVPCTKCGRLETLAINHVERLKAAGIPWTCRTGTGCDLIREPKNQPQPNKEKTKL